MPQPEVFYETPTGTANADDVTVPSSRNFREAWDLSGNVIEVNMTRARQLYRGHLRDERAARWREVDSMHRDATDGDNPTQRQAWREKRQKFRDAPQHASIEAAATPEDLIALTFDALTA